MKTGWWAARDTRRRQVVTYVRVKRGVPKRKLRGKLGWGYHVKKTWGHSGRPTSTKLLPCEPLGTTDAPRSQRGQRMLKRRIPVKEQLREGKHISKEYGKTGDFRHASCGGVKERIVQVLPLLGKNEYPRSVSFYGGGARRTLTNDRGIGG